MGLIEDVSKWTTRQRAPVTLLLIVSLVASSAILFLSHQSGLDKLGLLTGSPTVPWSFVTYPWAFHPYGSGMNLLLGVAILFWLYQVGTSVEREMGSLRFALFWIGSTALAGLALWLGANMNTVHIAISEPYLPVAAMTIAWSVRNRTAVVMLYGVIPLNGVFIGWTAAVLTLVTFGARDPVMGALACIHLVVTYFFAADRIPKLRFAGDPTLVIPRRRINPTQKEATTRGQVQYDQSYFDDVKRREQERLDRERLKKLLGEDD